MLGDFQSVLESGGHSLLDGNLIVCSENNVDSSFIVHHMLALGIKQQQNVCFVGLSQILNHYVSVGRKLGVDLTAACQAGQLDFVDGLLNGSKLLHQNCIENNDGEREVKVSNSYDEFQCICGTADSIKTFYVHLLQKCQALLDKDKVTKCLLILDDVTVLSSLGVPRNEIESLILNLYRVLHKTYKGRFSFLVSVSRDQEEEHEALCNILQHNANLFLSVDGLPTGYCRDVHGILCVEWRGTREVDLGQMASKKMQFKITDKGVSFFAFGTSSAVL